VALMDASALDYPFMAGLHLVSQIVVTDYLGWQA
jgi:hypothetical protein